MKQKPMRCRRVRADLLRAADGELELEQRFALDQHLELCRECRALSEGLALADQGAARLSAQAELAGERLDLDRAMARLNEGLANGETAAAGQGRGVKGQSGAPSLRAHVQGLFKHPVLVAGAACLLGLWGWQLAHEQTKPSGPSGNAGLTAEVLDEADQASIADEPPESSARSEAIALEGPARETSDRELERIARESASVRFAQVCSSEFAPVESSSVEDCTAAADRVDAALENLSAAGWPLVRLAEGLIHDSDTATRSAAIGYLGARGNGAVAVRMGTLVLDDETGAAAVHALGHLAARGYSGGVNGLRRALESPERAAMALDSLSRVPSQEAAQALADVLRSPLMLRRVSRHLGGKTAARNLLVRALVRVGTPAVESLFGLAQDASGRGSRGLGSGLPADELLQAIAGIDHHGAFLAQTLEQDDGSSTAFAAVAISGDPALLPWLEQRANATRSSVEALHVLSEMPGQGVLAVMARLARRDRIPSGRMETALATVLGLDAERVGCWIAGRDARLQGLTRADGREERFELEAFGQLLLATASRSSGPGLLALTLAQSLSDDDRAWAALALAELGDEEAVLGLSEALQVGLAAGQEQWQQSQDSAWGSPRLLAAQLLAVRRVLGAGALGRCLKGSTVTQQDEVLAAIEQVTERGSLAVGVHRVARALDDRRGAGLAQLYRRNSQ